MREYIVELLKFKDDEKLLNMFEAWESPSFPINAKMVKEISGIYGLYFDSTKRILRVESQEFIVTSICSILQINEGSISYYRS